MRGRLRGAEVLGLDVRDADVARGWVRMRGKVDKEWIVPIDPELGAIIQTYLLSERPDTDSPVLSSSPRAATGPPLTPAGLRTIFRYRRARSRVAAEHPHAFRHSCGTALAEPGVDLAVITTLRATVTSSRPLAPSFRVAFDAAQARARADC